MTRRRGQRSLDVLDVHYYPQGNGVYGGRGQGDEGAAPALHAQLVGPGLYR